MANCGHITFDKDGLAAGRVRTLEVNLALELHKYDRHDARSDDSPTHVVFAAAAGGAAEVGAAWRKVFKDGDRQGQAFYALTLDDPSFREPLNVHAFPRDGEAGTFDLVWRRQRQQGRA